MRSRFISKSALGRKGYKCRMGLMAGSGYKSPGAVVVSYDRWRVNSGHCATLGVGLKLQLLHTFLHLE